MNRFLSVPLVLFVLLILFGPATSPIFAQAEPCGTPNTEPCPGLRNPLGSDNIVTLLNKILQDVVTYIAPPIVAIMVLVGGFQILFAGGDEEKFKTGKKTIYYAVIGYAILLVALGITSIIEGILFRGETLNP